MSYNFNTTTKITQPHLYQQSQQHIQPHHTRHNCYYTSTSITTKKFITQALTHLNYAPTTTSVPTPAPMGIIAIIFLVALGLFIEFLDVFALGIRFCGKKPVFEGVHMLAYTLLTQSCVAQRRQGTLCLSFLKNHHRSSFVDLVLQSFTSTSSICQKTQLTLFMSSFSAILQHSFQRPLVYKS